LNHDAFFVGEIECIRVSDGYNLYSPESVFADVPADQARALAGVELDADGMFPVPYDCLLVRHGERLCLFDAGMGVIAEAAGAPTAGRLVESLTAHGIAPGDIDVLVVSHAHADHIGGLVTLAEGGPQPAFPNARHVMWRREWEYWTDEAELDQMAEIFSGPARLCLPPIEAADLLELVDEEKEILTGIRVLPAPGHTPGHMVASIRSHGEEMIYLADTVLHVAEFEHVDRVSAFEDDHDGVRETRRRMLGRCADDEATVHAFHVADAGRVSREGAGFSWRPLR
jgi:glyoxylase-like metal-dependent hydrolase (beta-lactamase superfamily II)